MQWIQSTELKNIKILPIDIKTTQDLIDQINDKYEDQIKNEMIYKTENIN
jgi:hypothetical protein